MLPRIFKSGNSYAVRIPKGLAVIETAQEVEIERSGDTLIIRPAKRNSAHQHGRGQDAPHRAAQRQVLEGHALVAAEGSLHPDARGRWRPRCADRQARHAAHRTRLGVYKERLREILERKQINVVRAMLGHWCTCVMRSKVEPMKEVAALVRRHLEAINGLFQAAKRRARGFTRLSTIKTVIFLIAGKLDFHAVNPHARQPT